ncbi:hypothetical protein HPP92_011742 [Vanilla planifolia]|uniref:Uncharacterized protein n=1 Tax=Vanilla planifolia TaxID=51239 RepID=A0A835R2F1_VANPL|nr:hypothetical protein HPP92_011742 [Vanilla planifolia]
MAINTNLCILFPFLFLTSTTTVLSRPLLPVTSVNQTQVYIVHVEHPNSPSDLLHPADRGDWYQSFLPNTTLDSGKPRMVYTYSAAMSGFAALLTPNEVSDMESIPGFLSAWPDHNLHLRTTYTPALLGLDEYSSSLWQSSDKGEGIIIGVIDTGITPDHASFSDVGLPEPPLKWRGRCELPTTYAAYCSNKLIGAQGLVGGAGKSPIDTNGHGTHVAGIAAGSPVDGANVLGQARGTASGMAPRAHIASYRVCRPCSDSNIIMGFDKAITDGVDLVQISIGGKNRPYDTNGVVIGSFAALSKGILTINSAGNDGPFASMLDNDVPWILHVGAANIDRRATAVLKLGNGMEFVGMSAYQPDPSTAVDLPLVYPGVNKTQETLSCQKGSMTGFNVTGKMVLCGTGYIDPTAKAEVVKEAGGAAIVMMNQPSEANTINADPYTIPAVHISFDDALKVLNYFETHKNPTGTISFRGTEYGIRPSPTVASFSSRGPSLLNGGILKPDVIAPGVNILSAWPVAVGPADKQNLTDDTAKEKKTTFIFHKGTSMAAPHVSGVAALLKKLHPDWSPAAIKSSIMTSALTVDRDGNPITDDASGKPASIFAVGAGHINPPSARDPGLVYNASTEDYIPYLCGLRGYTTRKVRKIVKMPVKCKEKKGAEEVNYPAIQVAMVAATNKSVTRYVTNVGEASSSYTADVVEPTGVKVKVNPTTLQFTSFGEEQSFVVQLNLAGTKPLGKKEVRVGRLKWVSGKHEVSSPIVVTA